MVDVFCLCVDILPFNIYLPMSLPSWVVQYLESSCGYFFGQELLEALGGEAFIFQQRSFSLSIATVFEREVIVAEALGAE